MARSTTVQAIASAPSRTAWSAAGVMAAAANSGWWFTAGEESMSSIGWMEGTANDTLAMSVEANMTSLGVSGNVRPKASAFCRYCTCMPVWGTNSE